MKTYRPAATLALAAFASVLASGAASAAVSPQTATFDVSITIVNSCGITATPIAFGSQIDVVTAWEATGTVTATCTAKAPITVALDAGANGGTFAARKMKLTAGTDTIDYTLRSAAANGGSVYGDGTSTSALVFASTSTGAAQPFTIYGITASGQTLKSAGTYHDTVTATVTF